MDYTLRLQNVLCAQFHQRLVRGLVLKCILLKLNSVLKSFFGEYY